MESNTNKYGDTIQHKYGNGIQYKYGERYKQIWTQKSGHQCPGQSVHNILREGMDKLMVT